MNLHEQIELAKNEYKGEHFSAAENGSTPNNKRKASATHHPTKEQHRLIGHYQKNQPGPLLLVMGGIHGNEKAGVIALEKVFNQLKTTDPDFKGEFIGVVGNLQALKENKRFIDVDLNRQWTEEKANFVLNTPRAKLQCSEDKEQRALLKYFELYRKRYSRNNQNRNTILLDLHTFSSAGANAYCIATKVGESRTWASMLKVPTIIGMEKVLKGTTMNYFNRLEMVSFCFEAGQHTDPVSVKRMEAAIWLTLTSIGAIVPEQVPHYERHVNLLHEIGKDLPNIVEFLYRHAVKADDLFKMKPGYSNFQRIKEGELLAHDKAGEIRSPHDGMILMPLYQPQGEDGFFIVKEVN